MNTETYLKWMESLSSCAIEGNKFAIEMLELSRKDYTKFICELDKLERNNIQLTKLRHK